MQFARVSALFNKAIHLGHKSKATDRSSTATKPTRASSAIVDTHERATPTTLVVPDRPAIAPAAPPPPPAQDDAAQRLKLARALVEHMVPRVLEQDAMGVIFAVGLVDEPGCSVQQLSAEMMRALTSSGQLDELAKVRAETMHLKTLRERLALVGTPIDKAEQGFSRAFVDGFISYTSQHAAFTGRAAGDSMVPLPPVPLKKLARVREIYRLTHAGAASMRADLTSLALGHVASTMDDAAVKRLLTYLRSEPGKRATDEWAEGEERVQHIMRGQNVQVSMSKAFRMAMPPDLRSSNSESASP